MNNQEVRLGEAWSQAKILEKLGLTAISNQLS